MNDVTKSFVIPTAVLTIICLVVSAALSLTYSVANPIIEENNRIAEQAALMEVLPGADSFGDAVTAGLPDGVNAVYTAGNGAGAVCRVTTKGYGGNVVIMVGVDAEGTICGVKVLEQSETQGLGSRVMAADYTAQFAGKTDPDEVDSIAGSTVSSTALKNGIRAALDAMAKGV